MPVLSRNLKIQHPRNKLIPYKSPALWKTQANLFQNFPNWNTGREHVFKPNCVKRIVALCKTCKKTSSKAKQNKRSAFIGQNFEKRVLEKQVNSIQISCIVEDATKTISKLRKVEHQTRNHFQIKLCLENYFFVQKLQENFL